MNISLSIALKYERMNSSVSWKQMVGVRTYIQLCSALRTVPFPNVQFTQLMYYSTTIYLYMISCDFQLLSDTVSCDVLFLNVKETASSLSPSSWEELLLVIVICILSVHKSRNSIFPILPIQKYYFSISEIETSLTWLFKQESKNISSAISSFLGSSWHASQPPNNDYRRGDG